MRLKCTLSTGLWNLSMCLHAKRKLKSLASLLFNNSQGISCYKKHHTRTYPCVYERHHWTTKSLTLILMCKESNLYIEFGPLGRKKEFSFESKCTVVRNSFLLPIKSNFPPNRYYTAKAFISTFITGIKSERLYRIAKVLKYLDLEVFRVDDFLRLFHWCLFEHIRHTR